MVISDRRYYYNMGAISMAEETELQKKEQTFKTKLEEQKQFRDFLISVLNAKTDIIVLHNNQYLTSAGCLKLANIAKITWSLGEPEFFEFKTPKYDYMYTVKGTFKSATGETIDEYGSACLSEYGNKAGMNNPSNIRKKAVTACLQRGISALLGLRDLCQEEYQETDPKFNIPSEQPKTPFDKKMPAATEDEKKLRWKMLQDRETMLQTWTAQSPKDINGIARDHKALVILMDKPKRKEGVGKASGNPYVLWWFKALLFEDWAKGNDMNAFLIKSFDDNEKYADYKGGAFLWSNSMIAQQPSKSGQAIFQANELSLIDDGNDIDTNPKEEAPF
jgi:hypothetical protein